MNSTKPLTPKVRVSYSVSPRTIHGTGRQSNIICYSKSYGCKYYTARKTRPQFRFRNEFLNTAPLRRRRNFEPSGGARFSAKGNCATPTRGHQGTDRTKSCFGEILRWPPLAPTPVGRGERLPRGQRTPVTSACRSKTKAPHPTSRPKATGTGNSASASASTVNAT